MINKQFNGTGRAALIGVSMGGQGAFALLSRHPNLFTGAASISGCPPVSGPLNQAYVRTTVAKSGGNADNMWGPPGSKLWVAHDPLMRLNALRGKNLFLSAGSGAIGPPDLLPQPKGDLPEDAVTASASALELGAYRCSLEFALQLAARGCQQFGIKEGSVVTCTLTGHGLKDPDTAIKQSAGGVIEIPIPYSAIGGFVPGATVPTPAVDGFGAYDVGGAVPGATVPSAGAGAGVLKIDPSDPRDHPDANAFALSDRPNAVFRSASSIADTAILTVLPPFVTLRYCAATLLRSNSIIDLPAARANAPRSRHRADPAPAPASAPATGSHQDAARPAASRCAGR